MNQGNLGLLTGISFFLLIGEGTFFIGGGGVGRGLGGESH